jgi:Ni,Fe-hydrogenase III large subunit/Ni,Fe-hydrogenase III component G
MSLPSYQIISDMCSRWGIQIYRPGQTQLHFLIKAAQNLRFCCAELQKSGCYLVTMMANDERELEDHCFKIYHLFSHPTDNVFVTLELSIKEGQETYPSLGDIFPAVEVFEREIADLFGLLPEQDRPRPLHQTYLHNSYPEWVYPLRRNWSQETFQTILKDMSPISSTPTNLRESDSLPEGELYLPVGPIHAGVIEPGNFLFRIGGETIEQVDILLGYTHKGIERLFQSSFSILEGCRLAEKVSGVASFAHSLAYCKATEHLSRTNIPDETHLLRAIFLELERLLNHIGDCSALAHDLALEVTASDMAVLRERLMRLCSSLTNSRFLRSVNWPGGICLPRPLEKHALLFTVRSVVQAFLEQAKLLILRSDFRERTINTGILPAEIALRLGVTGLAARASGLSKDFRIQHPFGPYCDPEIQELIKKGAEQTDLPLSHPCVMTGDVFSRFLQRVIEVEQSGRLIEMFINEWGGGTKTEFLTPLNLHKVPNYETGLGYVESWCGDIVYWIMKDKFERIFRCKVRDPSMLNWPGLREAVTPGVSFGTPGGETALVDFPVINKSFNLSYSGVDL